MTSFLKILTVFLFQVFNEYFYDRRSHCYRQSQLTMESISSGVNFLRRRFSSQDAEDDGKSTTTSVLGRRDLQQQQQQAQYQQQSSNTSPHVQNGPPSSFSLAGLANKVSSAIRSTSQLFSWWSAKLKNEFLTTLIYGIKYQITMILWLIMYENGQKKLLW